MTKKHLAIALLGLAAMVGALLLAACGGGTTAPGAAPASSGPAPSQAPASPSPAPRPTETAQPKKPDKVKLGYGTLAVHHYWDQLAKDEGVFEKNGLDVELVFFQGGGTTALQALIAGELDFVQSGSSEVAAANAAGANLKIIASTAPQMNQMVVVTDRIKTAQDLKGAKIGISKFGGSSDTAVKTFLKKVGLEYQKDVAVLQVGDDRTRLAAMQGGTIDATTITAPGMQARPFGFRVLADLGDYNIMSEPGPMDTTAKMVKENPDVVRRMVKSCIDAIYLGQKERPAAIKAIKKFFRTDDQETAEANIDWAGKYFQHVPYVSEEGVQFAIDEAAESNPNLKGVKAAAYIDNSFVAEFDKSGYVKKLYGN